MRLTRRGFLKRLGIVVGGLAALEAPSHVPLAETEVGVPVPQPERMQKRQLGRTELMVSAIGFGGGPLGDPRQVRVVQEAIRMGVNFIDTAHSYGEGRSEQIVGEAIKGMREKVYIATKTGQRLAEGAAREIQESLERLQIEKIDLLQMHGVGSFEGLGAILHPGKGALLAVRELQRQGKVGFVGITGAHSPIDLPRKIDWELESDVMAAAIRTGEFDTVMISYHIEWPQAEELIALAKEHDVGVIIKKPFAAGKLISRYGVRRLLEFVLENPDVHTVIPGMPRPEHVWEDVPVGYK